MTGTDRISAALKEIGIVGEGQSASGAMAVDALALFNQMIGRWAIEFGLQFVELRTTKALTASVRDYTIGSGGDINIVRPVRIDRAGFVLDSTVTTPQEERVAVLTDQDWAAIPDKTLTSAAVDAVYFDRAFSATSRGTISTYPTVTGANSQIVLYSPQAAVGYSALTEDLIYPPGYDDALHYELARRLCRPYGRQVTPDLDDDASKAIAALRLHHHQPVTLPANPFIPGASRGRFDVTVGRFR